MIKLPPELDYIPESPEENWERIERIFYSEYAPIVFRDVRWMIENTIYISSKNEKLTLLKLNPVQADLLPYLLKHWVIILKARQHGVTTLRCALAYILCVIYPSHVEALIANTMDNAKSIFNIYRVMHKYFPPIIKPVTSRDNVRELYFSDQQSRLFVDVSIRGSGVNGLHLSEVDHMPDYKKIWTASKPSLSKKGLVVLESTGFGEGSPMDVAFQKAVDGKSRFIPKFYGWHANPEYADRVQDDFSDENFSDYERKIKKEFNLSNEQLQWRRNEIKDIGEKQFRQEYPAYPHEAFISAGGNVFEHQYMERIRLNAQPPIRSNDLEQIFFEPKPGHKYVAATDTAEGVGTDYCVTQIFDCTNADKFEQVAILRDNNTHIYEFIYRSLDLVKKYNEAFWGIEVNYDREVVGKVKDKGYTNMYRRTDPTSTRRDDAPRRTYGWLTDRNTKPTLVNEFRSGVENGYIQIHDEWTLDEMRVFSRNPLQKEIKGDYIPYGAPVGFYDDAVMAAMIAYEMRKHRRTEPTMPLKSETSHPINRIFSRR